MKSSLASRKGRFAFLVAIVMACVVSLRNARYQGIRDSEKKEMFDFYSASESPIVPSDDWEPLVGYWKGNLSVMGDIDLRLIFRVTPEYGQVFIYSLDQEGYFVAATATRFNPGTKKITFYFETIGGVYRGALDPDGQHMIGTWTQGGRTLPLDYIRYESSSEEKAVPREIRFAVEKTVTGEPETLVGMEGYWSGYLEDDDSLDGDDDQDFVMIQVEKLANDVVEPKLFLPNDSPLPNNMRMFLVQGDGTFKIVQDLPAISGVNAIFKGKLENKTLNGSVTFDDEDEPLPLTLKWSKERPDTAKKMPTLKQLRKGLPHAIEYSE